MAGWRVMYTKGLANYYNESKAVQGYVAVYEVVWQGRSNKFRSM